MQSVVDPQRIDRDSKNICGFYLMAESKRGIPFEESADCNAGVRWFSVLFTVTNSRMIVWLEAKRAGLLRPEQWAKNVVAGLVVGVVALPLAMAFAIASGAKPEQGLYTAIIAGTLVSVLGGSRVQIAGPTGAFVVILASITAQYGIDGLQIATLMAGAMLLIAGAAKLGVVIKFIPRPVIVGFTSGIAVVIWVGQWKDFFGLAAHGGRHFHEKVWQLMISFPHAHLPTSLIAILSLALVILAPKAPGLRRIPGPLIALVLATALQSAFHFNGVATIGSAFGGIPSALPSFHIPDVDLARVIELISPAFTIAMLGAIESLLSAVVADGMVGTRHNSNQELVGQGIANIVAPLFGGFAATGAIARTATNIRNGGNSPLAGVVHAATLVLVLVALAPLAVNIPLAALAAILFVVAWNMSEAQHFLKIARRAPPADVVILLTTFVLTVFVDLVVAVNIGVILAMLHFLRRMSGSVEVREQTDDDMRLELTRQGVDRLPPGVLVYSVDGPIFFGVAESFEQALKATHTEPKVLILRLGRVPFVDMTALQTLEDVIRSFQKRGVRVLLTEANELVRGKLERAGIPDLIGAENLCPSLGDAIVRSTTVVPRLIPTP
ncbi:MAG TPA: SulP family inorganic anion transporter [Steroidobacteraceae bacterium]|nr:SulP family inorganic anion transporter [Steroidobacteraceae bacterium]